MMSSESRTKLSIRSERALLESLSSRTWFEEVELEIKEYVEEVEDNDG